jgi:dTMP kinase
VSGAYTRRVAGLFITFEGPEGSGKTLQARRLVDQLKTGGDRARLTREPGGSWLGEQVRSIVLSEAPGKRGIDPIAEALLFNAARAQLVAEVIKPALEAGEIVVCDRFADSTLAYQGYGAGVGLTDLRAIGDIAAMGLVPDLTFLLDILPEVGLARKTAESRNRYEAAFDLAFHRRVRDGFLELARTDRPPGRWVVVDASRDPETVFADIQEAVATWGV